MDITEIRLKNIKDILSVLRFSEGHTKKEIASLTNLSFATVSNMCNELKEKNVLSEEKLDTINVGRTPNRICFLYQRFCTLCINLQMETQMEFAILNFRNEILFRHCYDIAHLDYPKKVIDYAKSIYDQMLAFPWTKNCQFVGVGIAVSGCFHARSGRILNSAVPMYENAPLLALAQEAFSLPCYIENEANLCALSMSKQGNEDGNLVYLHLFQGLGLGVLSNGKLLRGEHGFGAEISHIPLGDSAQICPSCGEKGCIESALSIHSFLQDFLTPPPDASLLERWEAYMVALRQTPELFSECINKKGDLLGILISILINLFDPSVLYIGGAAAQLQDLLEPRIFTQIQNRCRWTLEENFALIWDKNSATTLLNGINQKVYEQWMPFD
ncbi:MAG: ROK family protein [Candidatus Fimivivens sp.]